MDLQVAASTKKCHFLRVPTEIRLNIYRYLLLGSPRASLDPSCPEKGVTDIIYGNQSTDIIYGDQRRSACLDGLNDAQKDVYTHHWDNPATEGEGSVMYNYLAVNQSSPPGETSSTAHEENPAKEDEQCIAEPERDCEDECEGQRYPAILQTNHQIYDEAATLLYSSLVIEVRPSDVMFSDSWKGIVDPSENIWRSCPTQLGVKSSIKGRGDKGFNLNGTMDPHVFAKFEKFSFVAELNFLHEDESVLRPSFFVDGNSRTNREDEDDFIAYLSGKGSNRPPVSDIVQQFVNVLVHSPHISHLDVSLSVEVEAAFDINSEDEDEGDLGSLRELDDNEEMKVNAANERAAELVLEAGVLDPLRQLTDVKYLEFSFALLQGGDVAFEPKSKHLGILQDLKTTVEGNFVAKHGAA